MSCNKSFIPLTQLVLEKAVDRANLKNPDDEIKLAGAIDKVVLYDEEVSAKIKSLVVELKTPPSEPRLAITFRAILRPTITLLLTLTFVMLVLGQVGMFDTDTRAETKVENLAKEVKQLKGKADIEEKKLREIQTELTKVVELSKEQSEAFFKRWDTAFTIFLAIYGPIIGFWFGERTVEKKNVS